VRLYFIWKTVFTHVITGPRTTPVTVATGARAKEPNATMSCAIREEK